MSQARPVDIIAKLNERVLPVLDAEAVRTDAAGAWPERSIEAASGFRAARLDAAGGGGSGAGMKEFTAATEEIAVRCASNGNDRSHARLRRAGHCRFTRREGTKAAPDDFIGKAVSGLPLF